MKVFGLLATAVALAGTTLGQSSRYCDPLTDICYSSFSVEQVDFRLAIPEADKAPFDVILQIVAPIYKGWAAVGFGAGMTYNPLAVAWANGDEVVISSREALSWNVPIANPYAQYTLLKGSGANDTHFTMTALCRGCSEWTKGDGNPGFLNPLGTSRMAWAQSMEPVYTPSSNTSFFAIHDAQGFMEHDLTLARLPNFDELVASNSLAKLPGTPEAPEEEEEEEEDDAPAEEPGQVIVAPPQQCNNVQGPQFQLQVASGWRATKLAGGLTQPRAVLIDTNNNLLLLQNGLGVTRHTVDANGCITGAQTIIGMRNLNHGLWLDPAGTKLYASTLDQVYSWDYNPSSGQATNQRTIVTGMNSGGHITRTLLIPPGKPNLLVVSRGSDGNLDMPTQNRNTQRAVVKVFDLNTIPANGYPYNTGGWNAGWGLRNEVGLVVDPNNMLWGLENSADDLRRIVNGQTTDVHGDNPSEELNYLGDPAVPNNQWYGYPTCFTVWAPNLFPGGSNFQVNSQFVQQPNNTFTDSNCEQVSRAPRLSMTSHSAPLDGKFSPTGDAMYVSFHGSWNRPSPTGFKVVQIPFTQRNGGYEPVADARATNGYTDLFWTPNVQQCSGFSGNCFRPVGIAVNSQGWVYVTSDSASQGELFVLGRI